MCWDEAMSASFSGATTVVTKFLAIRFAFKMNGELSWTRKVFIAQSIARYWLLRHGTYDWETCNSAWTWRLVTSWWWRSRFRWIHSGRDDIAAFAVTLDIGVFDEQVLYSRIRHWNFFGKKRKKRKKSAVSEEARGQSPCRAAERSEAEGLIWTRTLSLCWKYP